LASKITEGLTSESLKVAISFGLTELTKKEGGLLLVKALREHILPLGSAEATKPFKAGQRPGILSKQSGETMISYISRRRRWYDMLRNRDKTIQLSDQMRGELLLDHANLSHNKKLMIMTSTFIDSDSDGVAEALVKQHALAHSIKAPDRRMTGWKRSYYGADNGASFTADYEAGEYAEESWHADELYAWYTDDAQDPRVTTGEYLGQDWTEWTRQQMHTRECSHNRTWRRW
jgi:hypothetical protein